MARAPIVPRDLGCACALAARAVAVRVLRMCVSYDPAIARDSRVAGFFLSAQGVKGVFLCHT